MQSYKDKLEQLEKGKAQIKISFRLICTTLFLESIAISFFIYFLILNDKNLQKYLLPVCLAIILLYFLPVIFHCIFRSEVYVVSNKEGDNWIEGGYSESRVRDLVRQAISASSARVSVEVVKDKEFNAWTSMPFFGIKLSQRILIQLTSGALHYLNPSEMKALILHEYGHHVSGNKLAVPAVWVVSDFLVLLIINGLLVKFDLSISFLCLYLFVVRPYSVAAIDKILNKYQWMVEHLADIYSAKNNGLVPIVNVLLKMSEEAELTEAVIALSAKRLIHYEDIDLGDVYFYFDDVRPEGRIYHDNLFQHSMQIVREIKRDEESIYNRDYINEELAEFLESRKQHKRERIRWRNYDANGKGWLNKNEIHALCSDLKNNPNVIICYALSDFHSDTHPSVKDRMLVLDAYFDE